MERLKGKVAIVTGAGKKGEVDGTGYATSMLFAREGAKVLLADISPENANARACAKLRQKVAKLQCSSVICPQRQLAAGMVEAAAVERFGKVNVLFNNVGLGGSGMVTEVDAEKWDRVMDVNLKSMIMACKHAVPRMAEAGGGSIINVSSIDALRAGLGSECALCSGKRRDDFDNKGDGGSSRTR